jgi:hypothetical protein
MKIIVFKVVLFSSKLEIFYEVMKSRNTAGDVAHELSPDEDNSII